jgi:hypothetical protein
MNKHPARFNAMSWRAVAGLSGSNELAHLTVHDERPERLEDERADQGAPSRARAARRSISS